LLTRADGAGTYTYTDYDANDRAHMVEGPWGGTVNYTYDALGRVHSTQVGSGEATTNNYDLLGRPSTVSVGTRVFTDSYTGADTVPDSLTRANGSVTSYGYNKLYMLNDIKNKKSDGTVLNEYAFTYDRLCRKDTEAVADGNAAISFTGSAVSYTNNDVNQTPAALSTTF